MLTRSIDVDPFDLTIEEKVIRHGKRICIVFAVAALTISALDLAGVRSLENASMFLHESRGRFADLPDRLRTGIHEISVLPTSASVTVAIPRDAILDAPKIAATPPIAPAPKVALASRIAPAQEAVTAPQTAIASPPVGLSDFAVNSNPSPVAELSASRHLDAVEFAMASPGAMAKAEPVALSISAPSGAAFSGLVHLASVNSAAMPSAVMFPDLVPVSLPMADPIPLDMVPMPRAAPGVPPPSPAQRLNLDGKEYAKAERCLANAVYWESRSEPVRGQMAVAQVVLNRVFSPFYPNDVCSVVYQNASRHLACQFTFACDGKRKVINERGAWARANRIAKQTLDGQIYVADVAKSTHYHATYVHPYWVREMRKTVRYGIHNFYRPIAWGNGSEQPAWGSAALAVNKK